MLFGFLDSREEDCSSTLRTMRSLKQQRRDARVIFEAGLVASDPVRLLGRHLRVDGEILSAGERLYDLAQHSNLYVVGAGKATAKMALAVEALVGERIAGGIVIVKRGTYGSAAESRGCRSRPPDPGSGGSQRH